MITSDIGNYYYKTQKELQTMKEQIETLQQTDKQGSLLIHHYFLDPQSEQLLSVYKSVKNHIAMIEGNINQNSEFFFNSLLNNFDYNVQKLPNVDDSKTRTVSSKKRNRNLYQQQSDFNLPQLDSLITLKKHTDLNVKSVGKISYKPKGVHSNYLKTKSQKEIKNEVQTKRMLTKTQLDKLGNDNQKDGLLGLINQGKIINGEESEYMLNGKNGSILKQSQVQILNQKDLYQKKQVQLECEEKKSTYKLDDQPNLIKSKPTMQHSQSEAVTLKQTSQFGTFLFDKSKSDNQQQSQQPQSQHKIAPRDNNEIMDTYSFHNFIIRKVIQEKVSERLVYYSTYNIKLGENCIRFSILSNLSKYIESNSHLVQINGTALVALAQQHFTAYRLEDLVQCFGDPDEFIQKLRIAKLMFKGEKGKLLAIIKIQAFARAWKAQRDYARLKIMVQKVIIIQNAARIFLQYKNTRKQIQKLNFEQLEKFNERQEIFKENWTYIKLQQRVEIHINNLSYEEIKRLTMEKYLQRQNAQITRIFSLKDPLVSIIYIAPFDLQNEIMNYFYKILELGEISNYKQRLHFVWPENHSRFPTHYSTVQLLLLSPKSIKRIKTLIKNRLSFIIPGVPSKDDIKISNILQIPLFSGNPQVQQIHCTKSGAKRLFNELQIPTAPGAFEIYDEKELINTLSILIVNNPQVSIWILKIEDETEGRGIAWLEVRNLGNVMKDKSIYNTQEGVMRVAQILQAKLKNKLQIAYPYLYRNYQEYLLAFARKGGIVEACPKCPLSQIESPSFCFKIEPDGNIQIVGTYDKIRINDFQPVACLSPKRSLPHINVEFVCRNVGEKLYEKGIFGFIQLDLISFSDCSGSTLSKKDNVNQLFWAIGLDCYLNSYGSACFYFDFLMKGKLDQLTGNYSIIDEQQGSLNVSTLNNNDQQRQFLYCPTIINEGLDGLQYKTFFQLCRLESISFNLEKKIGSTFILIDSLQSGIISSMTIEYKGESFSSVLKYMNDALEFLVRNVGRGNETSDIDSRTDRIKMMGILQKLKLWLKKVEKQSEPVLKKYQSSLVYDYQTC